MDFYTYLYFAVALIASIFWGCYGVMYEDKEYIETIEVSETSTETTTKTITTTKTKESIHGCLISWKTLGWWKSVGSFVSDFSLSFFGWISLYILIGHIICSKTDNIDIFLGTVAIICIPGYGFKISEKINQFSK